MIGDIDVRGKAILIDLICDVDSILDDKLSELVSDKLKVSINKIPPDNILTEENYMTQADLILYDGSLGDSLLNDVLDHLNGSQMQGEHILLVDKNDLLKDLESVSCRLNGIISLEGEHQTLVSQQLLCYARNSSGIFTYNELIKQYKLFFDIQRLPGFALDNDLNFTEVSEVFCKILGATSSELVGTNISPLFSSNDDFELMKSHFDADDANVYEAETYWNNAKAKPLKIKLIVSPRSHKDGTRRGYLGLAKDLKQMDKVSKQARRHEYLEKTYRFTRSLAHEIKNPLTTIALAVNELESDISVGDLKHDYLEIISRSSKRINLLLDELLSSSHSNSLQLVAYPFNDLVMETLLLIEDRLDLSETIMHTSINTDDDIVCMVDYPKMQIALTNILVNAVEAVEHNGAEITVSTEQNHEEVIINIADNGPEIGPKEQELLFDPFYSSKKSGVGLGLTMSQTIIKEHKGHIDMESEPGKGTVFTVCLPIHQQ